MGEFLCAAAIFLLAVMVIGHGMWVVVAWLLKALSGAAVEPSKHCPHCGRSAVRQGRCVACGAVPHVTPGRPALRDELSTTIQQLERLARRGTIPQQQCDELVALLQAEHASLFPSPSSGSKLLPEIREQHVPTAAPRPNLLPEVREQPVRTAAPGPSLVPASASEQIIDAILVEPPPVPARAVHPLDRPHVPPPAAPPRQPGKSLADMLQSFMEESNIRWGEILAAMLVVLCSVGLVISLRSTLKEIPYFPAILFTLFTVSFHGAGMYTLRRWKLQAVSRVILIISLLLVPLTFCGAITLQQDRPASIPLFLLALAVGTSIFTWISYSASRELVGSGAWPLAVGVLGPSLAQVFVQHFDFTGGEVWRLNLALGLPLACFLVATGWQIARASRRRQLSKPRIIEILRVLGIAAFALLVLLALLLVRVAPNLQTVARLSPQLSIAAAAVLALGLLIHRRTTARRLASWQTAGTAIVVLAGMLMLLLVAVTWPEPELLLAVGVINCTLLALLGFTAELPLLYVPSVACAALATTIGMHLLGGHFIDREQLSLKMVQAALMGRTSLALGGLGAVVSGLGVWHMTRRQTDAALMLLASAGGLVVVAILITLFSGFIAVPGWVQDRDLAAGVLLALAVALLLLPLPLGEGRGEGVGRGLTSVASLLFWLALVQALVFNTTIRDWLMGLDWLPTRPVLTATLVHGVVTALLALVAARRRLLAEPLAIGSAISLAAVVPFIVWVRGDDFSTSAAMALAAAAGWAMLAAAQRWPWAISGVQAMTALAPAIYIAGLWKARHGDAGWFIDEQHLFTQSIAVAIGAIVWSAARRLTSHDAAFRSLLNAPWPAVDQVLLGLATIALPAVAFLGVAPHVGWELGLGNSPALPLEAGIDAFGASNSGWIALAAILCALIVSLWERVSLPALVGFGVATFAAVWLAAEHFEAVSSAASAARWAAATYTALWAAAFIARQPLYASAKQITALRWDRFPREATAWFCAQPLLFGGSTILILTILAVQQHPIGAARNGPAAGTIFAAMGPTVSYAGPLVVLALLLLGYALRERQAAFALGGAVMWQLAVNLAYLLHADATMPGSGRAIEWLQWNSLAAGAYALVWLGLSRWITPANASERDKRLADGLWLVPVCVSALAALLLVGWATIAIVEHPIASPLELTLLGSWQSYLAVGLVLAAVLWRAAGSLELRGLGDAATWLAAALVPLVAASSHRFDPGGQWIAFHVLEAGWLTESAIACGLVCWQSRTKSAEFENERSLLSKLTPHHLSVTAIAAFVVLLTLRGNRLDPAQPWWSLGGVVGACAIATALGLALRSQPYAYLSTALAGLPVLLLWAATSAWPWITLVFGPRLPDTTFGMLEAFVIAVVAPAGFWLSREISSQRRLAQSFDMRTFVPRVHTTVMLLLVPVYCLYRLGISAFASGPLIIGFETFSIVATLALGGLLLATLWDRRAMFVLPLSFLWLGAAWCLVIGLAREWLVTTESRYVMLTLAIALQVALTGQLWSYGANLAAWASRVGISDPIAGLVRTEKWLPAINLVLTALVCILSLGPVLVLPELSLRVGAAWGPAIAAWGVLCLAQERRRDALQLASLLLAGLSAVFLAWAQIDPHEPAVWMTRVFRLLMVLGVLTFAYGLVLPRLLLTAGSWNAATRKAGYIAGAAALVAFAFTLALEVQLFNSGQQAAIDGVQVIAIAVVLVALIAGLISLAVLPGRDPLVLSEQGRQGYVYAAEATATLLFAHVYVCRPEWFGLLTPYWPFIVMGIAFAGVGAAEIFERRRIRVLAEPLSRTGAMLPLLPVLGWWVPGSKFDYSLLLLITGILYLVLSYTRKSWAAMIAATIAGNGALWALLSDTDFAFASNPQLWLIPPALSVLVAAQLNRRRLAPEALAAIRYAATVVIYVSSTSEIFLRGFAGGVWPPMILLGLAVAGVLVGIALRIRAFLLLGMLFTLMALIAMIRHASHSIDHTWPWWAFGITLSVAALVLLGLREKKEAEITLLISRLRQWEP